MYLHIKPTSRLQRKICEFFWFLFKNLVVSKTSGGDQQSEGIECWLSSSGSGRDFLKVQLSGNFNPRLRHVANPQLQNGALTGSIYSLVLQRRSMM